MTQARVIITLQVLLDIFKAQPMNIVEKIISLYAEEYDVALREFDRLYGELAPINQEAASIWTDLKNALNKMSTVERNRLRLECRKHLGWIPK